MENQSLSDWKWSAENFLVLKERRGSHGNRKGGQGKQEETSSCGQEGEQKLGLRKRREGRGCIEPGKKWKRRRGEGRRRREEGRLL